MLFGDRFPFRYLVDDYGLSYYAAFAGCSAETEASFGTISFLAGKVDELRLPMVVLDLEGAQHKVAELSCRIPPKESVHPDAGFHAVHHIHRCGKRNDLPSVMESNLDVLKQALN